MTVSQISHGNCSRRASGVIGLWRLKRAIAIAEEHNKSAATVSRGDDVGMTVAQIRDRDAGRSAVGGINLRSLKGAIAEAQKHCHTRAGGDNVGMSIAKVS